MADNWVSQLRQLNDRLVRSFSDQTLGNKGERRAVLQRAGSIQRMERLSDVRLRAVLGDKILVGVDGSINTFGGQYPYYVDLLRALAKPTRGEALVLTDLHCPLPPEGDEDDETALRKDNEARQQKLAELEVQVAIEAIDRYEPAVILMDGPLVRFDMRAKDSFLVLCDKVITRNIVLLGCIENIESKVLDTVLGTQAPSGWRNRFDRDLLWDTLDFGEVLVVEKPGKGLPRPGSHDPAVPICTWFMRSSYDPAVVGLDVLAAQVPLASRYIDYLFTLSPADGRGIPIWLDLVDREVRLTDVELEAYTGLLEPDVKRIFRSKRDARFY
ncbi:MAG TPA: DNA double-strand break repair nuclease NurA [Symbiobacteriaceae bacterium]|nr:DNA double-strand break repair nuclease NurA [Symbiobacteriaceae bacterium]